MFNVDLREMEIVISIEGNFIALIISAVVLGLLLALRRMSDPARLDQINSLETSSYNPIL